MQIVGFPTRRLIFSLCLTQTNFVEMIGFFLLVLVTSLNHHEKSLQVQNKLWTDVQPLIRYSLEILGKRNCCTIFGDDQLLCAIQIIGTFCFCIIQDSLYIRSVQTTKPFLFTLIPGWTRLWDSSQGQNSVYFYITWRMNLSLQLWQPSTGKDLGNIDFVI